ncbi:MAG: peptidylprolyl isomerase [Microbacterium sp.]|nr:MAG: peptidylprolyl isomerase [Microbacterium sp.]
MLRIPAVIAVLGLSALTLAACSSAPAAASCDRVDSTTSALELIQPSGAQGSPEISLDAPVYVDDTVFTDVTVGNGPRVTSDAQDVVFTVAIANGATGKSILTSGTQVQPLSSWRENYAGLAKLMMCATEGSRIVGAIPASDLSADAAQNFGVAEDQSIAVTLDLDHVYLAAADGVPQYNDRRGMPSVVLAPGGRPGITIPDATPPSELAVELLKKGTGAASTDDDTVRVHYTSVSWDTRKVIDSTWESGASTAVTPSDSIPFAPELIGATVGSQLLVVVPGASEGESATVYVVDILGIDPPAAATTQ